MEVQVVELVVMEVQEHQMKLQDQMSHMLVEVVVEIIILIHQLVEQVVVEEVVVVHKLNKMEQLTLVVELEVDILDLLLLLVQMVDRVLWLFKNRLLQQKVHLVCGQ